MISLQHLPLMFLVFAVIVSTVASAMTSADDIIGTISREGCYRQHYRCQFAKGLFSYRNFCGPKCRCKGYRSGTCRRSSRCNSTAPYQCICKGPYQPDDRHIDVKGQGIVTMISLQHLPLMFVVFVVIGSTVASAMTSADDIIGTITKEGCYRQHYRCQLAKGLFSYRYLCGTRCRCQGYRSGTCRRSSRCHSTAPYQCICKGPYQPDDRKIDSRLC